MVASAGKSRRIVLKVNREIFETFEETLNRFPKTLLGNAEKRREYCDVSGRYCFNRCLLGGFCFDSILYYFQSNGSLLCPPGIPIETFKEECVFFQLPIYDIDKMVERHKKFAFHVQEVALPDNNGGKSKSKWLKIWDFLDDPKSSNRARIFAFISFIVMILSIVVSSFETMKPFHHNHIELSNHWIALDLAVNVYFLIEFTVRIIFCPSKLDFLKGKENWLDCSAVIPYFVLLLASKEGVHQVYHHRYLRVPRFIRMLRLLRLSRYSRRIQIVEEIIKASAGDLQLLLLCAMVVVTFGGSVMFVVEEHWNPVFTSTPQALWWAVQTLTTVGYGDVIPETIPGKLVATCLMVFGAGTMTLPILGIVTKFVSAYSDLIDENVKRYRKK